jgi:hypothetical protein
LDFIGTSPAVKTLFSIPIISEQSLCVAVHNIDGTLLIDEAVPDDYDVEHHDNDNYYNYNNATASTEQRLPPSISQSLVLALSNSNTNTNSNNTSTNSEAAPSQQPQSEALALLSSMMEQVRQTEDQKESSKQQLLPTSTSTSTSTSTTMRPSPVREYLEWKFQEHNLLVASEALIVRPENNKDASPGVVVRVEEVHHLQQSLVLQRQQQRNEQPQAVHESSSPQRPEQQQQQRQQRSYAQALLKPQQPPPKEEQEQQQQQQQQQKPSLNLDQVPLQTCIVPSSGPLGGLLEGPFPSVQASPFNTNTATGTTATAATAASPKCIVLDAYLDNLMANVPQLALCLQEKGLIQSVKLLETEQIPSMMMHPTTLDTSIPVDKPVYNKDTPDLFSPQIMEMNASALLRFLKANCTKNNATYLLRSSGGGDQSSNTIQLYDISSITSQQRQKKWIWWLATMSYRFALRLRQLEGADVAVLPLQQKRAFRDRQRSLLQTTLDLLQDLLDMDGNAHESLVASVREHMADTFLGSGEMSSDEPNDTSRERSDSDEIVQSSPPPVMSSSPPSTPDPHPSAPATQSSHTPSPQPTTQQQQQPYAKISVDALNKAHDHLVHGIKTLWPVLQHHLEPAPSSRRRKRGRVGTTPETEEEPPSTAMVLQLFGLNYKVVNVSLRLAEHHLRNYYSSSAMQALRNAARRMADSVSLLEYNNVPTKKDEWMQRLQLQYTWLWEHCGHFARSFASDELWRDRGHACGDDVLSVLKDVEAAFSSDLEYFSKLMDPLAEKTRGDVSLQSLSAIVSPPLEQQKTSTTNNSVVAARNRLAKQRQLQLDKRQVLVASCISYSRAILVFQDMTGETHPEPSAIHHRSKDHPGDVASSSSPTILNLLRQRLGDACNETGKVLLAALRTLLTSKTAPKDDTLAAEAMLDSAQFWFLEGLDAFEACGDLRNMALVRCNLCQCCKLRANSSFASKATADGATHAEVCLQEAATQLQAAHEALGVRDVDSMTWDMVSEELAATFLVLAVRRRQSLLGGGNTPVLLEALRLSPGKERSIVEPMEKALEIYEQSGNAHQAAAVYYQLALTNSKTWTCQRDEGKTREKLSAAFQQYNMAFAYFSYNLRGNEPTFVLLCLDLASLYAAVAGEECLTKALSRCLDTYDAFSQESIDAARDSKGWLEKMETLASSVEERVFKLLRSLVKLESDRYKDLYREGLTAKMVRNVPENEIDNSIDTNLLALHDVLVALRKKFYS